MNRAWSNKFTDQQTIDTWLGSFYSLICLFSQPCYSSNHLNTFSFIWFLLKTSHNQSCALLKCSPPATMCTTPPGGNPAQSKRSSNIVFIFWGFTHKHRDKGFPGIARGQGQTRCSSLWVLKLCSCLPWCPCISLGLWRWAFDGLTGPVMGQTVARAEYCLGSPSHYYFSVLCCQLADKLLTYNLMCVC